VSEKKLTEKIFDTLIGREKAENALSASVSYVGTVDSNVTDFTRKLPIVVEFFSKTEKVQGAVNELVEQDKYVQIYNQLAKMGSRDIDTKQRGLTGERSFTEKLILGKNSHIYTELQVGDSETLNSLMKILIEQEKMPVTIGIKSDSGIWNSGEVTLKGEEYTPLMKEIAEKVILAQKEKLIAEDRLHTESKNDMWVNNNMQ